LVPVEEWGSCASLARPRRITSSVDAQCLGVPPPEGTLDGQALNVGIKEMLHATGTRMTAAIGSGWSVRSLNEIIQVWKII
jgi:anaphase-promoting complex subunit 1